MKFGFRTPSLKKRISARTSLKRVVRHRMGVKAPRGMGMLTNSKRALYNKVYRKTTFGIENLARLRKAGKKQSGQEAMEPVSQFSTSSPILDKHFELSENIPLYYKKREDEGLEKTIETCRQQIELAPQAKAVFLEQYPDQLLPSHRGYEQLVIVLDKQGKYDEAIRLCEQAKNEGWSGDWDRRIVRYKAKGEVTRKV